jgi:osmotically-inducible protein OsmY
MTRLLLIQVGIVVSACSACSVDTSSEPRRAQPDVPAMPVTASQHPATARESPADRGIRRNLVLAIDGDADLRQRDISFVVANGDVSVAGTVRTEEERRKVNDLALRIEGVKSIANALRVSE